MVNKKAPTKITVDGVLMTILWSLTRLSMLWIWLNRTRFVEADVHYYFNQTAEAISTNTPGLVEYPPPIAWLMRLIYALRRRLHRFRNNFRILYFASRCHRDSCFVAKRFMAVCDLLDSFCFLTRPNSLVQDRHAARSSGRLRPCSVQKSIETRTVRFGFSNRDWRSN